MNKHEIAFKRDTGLSAFDKYDVESMMEPYDPDIMNDTFNGYKDLINAFRHDAFHNLKECIVLDDTKIEIDHSTDEVKVYREEYVKWLEEKLNI